MQCISECTSWQRIWQEETRQVIHSLQLVCSVQFTSDSRLSADCIICSRCSWCRSPCNNILRCFDEPFRWSDYSSLHLCVVKLTPLPSAVVKQRMQVHGSKFRSVPETFKTVYRTEGLGAFYVSYPTTLTMTVPFTAVQFSTYEFLKYVHSSLPSLELKLIIRVSTPLHREKLNPSGVYSPLTHVTAGGIAGAVAAAVTTPLDVCKTLLQTRGTSDDAQIRKARGMGDAFRIIWERQGLKGFSRGLTPRILTNMPSNALCCTFPSFSHSSFEFPLTLFLASQGYRTKVSDSSSEVDTTNLRQQQLSGIECK